MSGVQLSRGENWNDDDFGGGGATYNEVLNAHLMVGRSGDMPPRKILNLRSLLMHLLVGEPLLLSWLVLFPDECRSLGVLLYITVKKVIWRREGESE